MVIYPFYPVYIKDKYDVDITNNENYKFCSCCMYEFDK